ncbi:MAG: hypothetical protein Q9227_008198 [Pyrenula ochraceoflavens]
MADSSRLLPLESHVTSNSFLHVPEGNPGPPIIDVIFFLPGNPGLVEYYHKFLNLVSLSSTKEHHSPSAEVPTFVYGASLLGFELPEAIRFTDLSKYDYFDHLVPSCRSTSHIHTLQDEIDLSHLRLQTVVSRIVASLSNQPCVRVTLIGHSLGAYMAVKINQQHMTLSAVEKSSFEIKSLILLMPPIGALAWSPNGLKANPIIVNVPYFPSLLQLVVRTLAFFLPKTFFHWLVTRRMGGLGSGLENAAVGVTIKFLRSQAGVKQSIALARDELRQITKESWGEEIWGHRLIRRNETKRVSDSAYEDSLDGEAKIHLYFAEKDGWVEKAAFEELEKALHHSRKSPSSPVVNVEKEGRVLHDFCVRGSECAMVAEKVALWIKEDRKAQ